MLSDVTAIAGLIGLIVSLCFVAWQTRAVARQTAISNAIAGVSALNTVLSSLREVYMVFIDHPELRPYFYGGREMPRSRRLRRQVSTIAEMLADVLESGLLQYRLVPASESFEIWENYCRYMLARSPALHALARKYPEWWPELNHFSDETNRRTVRSPQSAPDASRPTSRPKSSPMAPEKKDLRRAPRP
jgi:hypothetical protein